MEDKWYVESQLLLAVFEAEERDEVVYDRLRCIFRSDEVKSYARTNRFRFLSAGPTTLTGSIPRTSDQIGELFLESQAILRVPLELLWCDKLDSGINNLGRKRRSVDRVCKSSERVEYPRANELVLPLLPLHLILHLLHDAAIDLYHIPVSEGIPTIRSKERPIPNLSTNKQEDKTGTHLNKKLILASTYEIPSSIEDNRNSLTYALNTGANLTTSYPPNHHQQHRRRGRRKKEKKIKTQNKVPTHPGNSKRLPELSPNLQKPHNRESPLQNKVS